MSKLFVCTNIKVLAVLLKASKCINGIAHYFSANVAKTSSGHKLEYETIFNPEYLQAMQMDCFQVVSEIMFLFGKLKPFIDTIEEDSLMVSVTHIVLVTSCYLQAFVVENAEFHAKAPPPYKIRTRKCSVWKY